MVWRRSSLALVLLALTARAGNPELHRIEAIEPHMGTMFRIVLYSTDDQEAQTALRAAFDRVAELDKKLSDYDPNSELMQATKAAYRHPIRVSPELFHVLEESQKLAAETDGAFDVTLGPLTRLWRQARASGGVPSTEDVNQAAARTGYRNLVLHREDRTIELRLAGMQIDLGAIAKGYAADEALGILREHQIGRSLVAASGDLAIGDPPPGAEGWDVGIDPIEAPGAEFPRVLKLRNRAVSTSGDSQQHLDSGGRRFSHILDARTKMGLSKGIGVSVIAPMGIHADSLATAASVVASRKGVEAGLDFVERHAGASALIVYPRDGGWEVKRSQHFPMASR